MAGDRETPCPVVSDEWNGVRRGGEFHARNRFDSRQNATDGVGIELRVFLVFKVRQLKLHGEQPVRIEAEFDSRNTPKALNQQPRADQENDGERSFRHYQCAAQSLRTLSWCDARRSGFERFDQIGPRSLPRRKNAEDQPCEGRERRRKEQHPAVNPYLVAAWKSGGHQPYKQVASP